MMLGNSYNGEQQVIETGSLRANGDGDIGIGGGNGGLQLKKGPWTAAEDAILTEYVRKHGEGNWNAVQRNTGLARCGKSCRLRWANHLRPNLKKGAFSPEEERIIVELHAQLGNKWARMAAQLPGRTDNEIKNYWNTRVKRRHRQGLPLYPPDVQPQHKNQNQQFSISQTNSHSHHHSYHSLPTTPTTPTSSFSFQTIHTTPSTPTSATSTPHHHYTQHQLHQLHHYQFPPCHSPTPPPALSSTPPPLSPNLHSPTFPTLTLFDSNAHNPSNSNNNNTNNNNPFNMPRSPPILQTPLRFKRFHSDPSINTGVAVGNNNAINNNNNNNNNNNGCIGTSNHPNGSFSLPYSPFVQTTQSPLPSPQANNNNNNNNNTNSTSKLFSIPSFSSNYVEFSSGSTSSNFRTQFEKDCVPSNGSVFSLKQELPSSQLLSQNNNGGNSGMTFDNTKVINHDNVSSSGSGLLEDLLEEAQAMANNYGESSRNMNGIGVGSMEEKRGFSGFNPWNCSGSANSSSGMKPKEEPGAQMDNMHEDLSKLLNVIPSMQVPEWYNDNGEASNCQSSVVTDDNLGLEMQQIASMFSNNNSGQVRNTNSCSCDNLPGLC